MTCHPFSFARSASRLSTALLCGVIGSAGAQPVAPDAQGTQSRGVAASRQAVAPRAAPAYAPAIRQPGTPVQGQPAGELSMIDLQSLASKRAATLQLTTGMLKSMDESSKDVARNIGGGGSSPPPPAPCKTCLPKAK